MRFSFLLIFFLVKCSIIFANASDSLSIDNSSLLTKEYSIQESLDLGLKPIELYAGEIFLPKHDGVNYFVNLDKNQSLEDPSPLKIQQVIAKAKNIINISNINDLITGSANLNFNSLPIVIKESSTNLNLSIVILSLVFKRGETTARIGVVSNTTIMNAEGVAEVLYFGGEFTIGKGGGLKGGVKLISPTNIELDDMRGVGQLNLATSTGVCLGCDNSTKSLEFYFAGSFDFHPFIAVAEAIENGNVKLFEENNSVPSLYFGVKLTDWNNLNISMSLPLNYGIRFKKFEKFGFYNNEAVTQEYKPDNYEDQNINSFCALNLTEAYNTNIDWQVTGNNRGITFENIKIRLPIGIRQPKTAAGQGLTFLNLDTFSIMEGQVNAKVEVNSTKNTGIFNKPLKLGEGFDIVLNKASLWIENDHFRAFSLEGGLRLPTDLEGNYSALNFTIGLATNSGENSLDVLTFGVEYQRTETLNLQLFGNETRSSFIQIKDPAVGVGGDVSIRDWNFDNLSVNISVGSIGFISKNFQAKLSIDELVVQNVKPFVKTLKLSKAGNEGDTNLGGFSFSVESLGYTMPNEDGEFSLETTVGLELGRHKTGSVSEQSAFSIGAQGDFVVKGFEKYDETNDKYYYEFERVTITGVKAELETSKFYFKAGIHWFENQAAFGMEDVTGFRGDAVFILKLGKIVKDKTVSASAIFITVDNRYKAWAFDVMGSGLGIPLGPTGVTLETLIGGAYKNFSFSGNKLETAANGKTGMGYKLSEGSWGFNFGAGLGFTKVDFTLMIAAEGVVGQGLTYIKGIGQLDFKLSAEDILPDISAKFTDSFNDVFGVVKQIGDPLQKVPKTVGGIDKSRGLDNLALAIENKMVIPTESAAAKISAALIYTQNFEEDYLSIILKPIVHAYISTPTGGSSELTSTGYGILYLSDEARYLNLGDVDNRLGLRYEQLSSGVGLGGSIGAYIMVGDNVPNSIPSPQVPADFQSKFISKSADLNMNSRNYSTGSGEPAAVRNANGFAIGAVVKVHADFKLLGAFLSARAEAGVGFDALVIERPVCKNVKEGWGYQPGPNSSWNATAQVYGYADVNLNTFGVALARVGVAFLLQANIPQPLHAKGQLLVYARIWKSEVYHAFEGEIGNSTCTYTEEIVESRVEMIDNLSPTGSESFIKGGNLYLNCKSSYEQIKSGTTNEDFKQVVKTTIYSVDGSTILAVLPIVEVENVKNKLGERIEIPVPILNTDLVNWMVKGESYKVKVETFMTANSTSSDGLGLHNVQGNSVVGYLNGTSLFVLYDTEEYTINVSNKIFELPEQDVLLYPAKDQLNVYKEDYGGKGFLSIDETVVQNANLWTCTLCKDLKIKIDNNEYPINVNDSKWVTDFRIDNLDLDKIYEIKITGNTASGEPFVAYEKHFFKTDKSYTQFLDKIEEINSNNEAEYNSADFEFAIQYNGSNEISFGKNELDESLLFSINTENDWFNDFKTAYNSFPFVFNWDSPFKNIEIQQLSANYLEDGAEKESETSNTNTNLTFVYNSFYPYILEYISNYNSIVSEDCTPVEEPECAAAPCYPIPFFPASEYCIDVANDINEISYFKERLGIAALPTRFSVLKTQFCFNSLEPIEFCDVNKLQKTVVVSCKRSGFDSKPIELTFSLKKEENIIPFPENFTINHNIPGVDESGDETFKIIDNSFLTFNSKESSYKGCPNKNEFSVQSSIGSYEYQFIVEEIPRETIKPCLRFEDITNAYLNQLGSEFGVSGSTSSSTRYFLVSAYEDASASAHQKITVPFNFTFWNNVSNGSIKTFTFTTNGKDLNGLNEGSSEIVSMNEHEVSESMTIKVEPSSPFICGENKSKVNLQFYSMSIVGSNVDYDEACGAPNSSTVYTTTNPLNFETTKTTIEFFSNNSLISTYYLPTGYYAYLANGVKEIMFIKNGIFQGKSICSGGMQLECTSTCEDLGRGKKEYTIKYTFKDAVSGNAFIPFNIPSEGLVFVTSLGNKVNKPKDEITSSSGEINFITFSNATCEDNTVGIVSVNIPGTQGCTPPNSNCSNPPSKPTVVASKTNVAYGETITLTASGCTGGEYLWNISKKGAEITETVTQESTYTAQCLKNGCLSEKSETKISLLPLEIKAAKSFACSGTEMEIKVEGCAGQINWFTDNGLIDFGDASASTVSITLTEATTIKVSCKTNVNGKERTKSVEKDFDYVTTPLAPVITHNIPSDQLNRICAGESVTLTASVCNIGNLTWKADMNKIGNPVVITPSDGENTYFATCKNQCSSPESNTISVNSLRLPTPTISVQNTAGNNVCSGQPITLSTSNCGSDQTVYWYEAIGSGSFTELSITGSSINYTPTIAGTTKETHKYQAYCKQNISATKRCEGLASNIITVTVINTTTDMAITPDLASKDLCSYQSVILSATGCNYGLKQWKTGSGSWLNQNQIMALGSDGSNEYYVRCNLNNNCFNTEHVANNDKKTTVTVYQEPIKPTNLASTDPDNAFCKGTSISISGSCQSGYTIGWEWQNGTQLSTISNFVPTQDETYYAYCSKQFTTSLNCRTQSANRASLAVDVHTIPEKPTLGSTKGWNICDYENTTISASTCNVDNTAGTLYWIIDGGSETTSPTLSNINQSHSYKVRCQVWECTSVWSDQKDLTVHARPAKPSISTTNSGYVCSSDNNTDITLSSNCPSAHTTYWYKAGSDTNHTGSSYALDGSEASGTYTIKCKNDNTDCWSEESDGVSVDIREVPTSSISGPSTVCSGQSFTLNLSNCSNGTVNWTSGETGSSITTSLTSTSTFTASCDISGCTKTATYIVTVKPTPPIPSITGTTDFCSSTGKVLSARGCSGTVTWSDDVAQTSESIAFAPYWQVQRTISGVGYHSYKAKCTVNNCDSDESSEFNFTLYQTPDAPTVSTNSNVICNGAAVTLTASETCSSGGQYSWFRSSIANGTFTYCGDSRTLSTSTVGYYKVNCDAPNTDNSWCKSDFSSSIQITSASASAPTVTTTTESCNYKITYSGCSGGTVRWYYEQSPGVYDENDPQRSGSYNDITYLGGYPLYFKCTKDGCSSGYVASENVSVMTPDYEADFQRTTSPKSCNTSGYTITCIEEYKDINPCSSTYNNLRNETVATCNIALSVTVTPNVTNDYTLAVTNSSSANCSRQIQWTYRSGQNDIPVGTGESIQAQNPGQYRASCTNNCDSSSSGTGYIQN